MSRAEGDIVFSRIQHTATAVVVYMRFRQLTVPKQYADFTLEFEGTNGRSVEAEIFVRHGLPQGEDYVFDQTGRRCAHSNHINYAGDSAWMRIARGCLKDPKYIRVQARSRQIRISPTEESTEYYDTPTGDGGNNYDQLFNTWTPWVVTG